MNPNDPNVVLLEVVAERLGAELRERLVFIGGAVAGLLITDPAMPAIRPTEDVDLVTHVAALKDFHAAPPRRNLWSSSREPFADKAKVHDRR